MRDEFKKEIALILDTKTRWKSFIDLDVDIGFSEKKS